jgi:hypothetical protein
MKAAALVAQSEHVATTDMRYRVVTESLSRHWGNGVVGPTYGVGKNQLDSLEDVALVRGVDAFGNLAQWNLSTGDTEWIRSISSEPVYYFAATPDGDVAVAADTSVLRLIHNDPWTIETTEVDQGIAGVEISDDGAVAMVAGVSGKLWAYDIGAGALTEATLLGEWDRILAIEHGAREVFALVVTNDELSLVNQSGEVMSETVVGARVDLAAIGPEADFVAAVIDGQVWTAGRTLALSSTGAVLAGIPTSLAVTRDGLVIVGDRSAGTRVLDPSRGLFLGDLCEASGAPAEILVAENQEDVLCRVTSSWVHDSLTQLRPVSVAAGSPAPTLEVTSAVGTIASIAIRDGLLVITPVDRRPYAIDGSGLMTSDMGFTLDADVAAVMPGYVLGANDLPTTIAINGSGTSGAAGFRDGVVVEFDVLTSGDSMLVSRYTLPGKAPIHEVSWSTSGEVLATDEEGTTWGRPSCAGCFSQGLIFEKIRERLWSCYLPSALEELGEGVRELFDPRPCAMPPEVPNS